MTEAATAENITADDWAAAMAEQGAAPGAGAATDNKLQVAAPPVLVKRVVKRKKSAAPRGKICPTCGERYGAEAAYCGKDSTKLVPLN